TEDRGRERRQPGDGRRHSRLPEGARSPLRDPLRAGRQDPRRLPGDGIPRDVHHRPRRRDPETSDRGQGLERGTPEGAPAPAARRAPLVGALVRVLGIESSCDETSASVVSSRGDDVTLDSLVILSQDVHAIFGGVVPEIASRAHLAAIVPVVKRALAEASSSLDQVDAVGVTNGPGLVGALLVGVSFAKSLSASLGVPVIGVNHLEGHLFATALEDGAAVPPFTALLASGGHTMLLDVPAWGEYRLLGATRDDAAGEAFDKTAKLLGLPSPGGRHIEALAKEGDPSRFRFTRPMLHGGQRAGDADYYDVSFS